MAVLSSSDSEASLVVKQAQTKKLEVKTEVTKDWARVVIERG